MRESNFTTDVMKSLRRVGAWAYKIPDAPSSKITGLRFTISKPCDIVACIDGKFIAIETKFKKKFAALSMRDMQDSQLVNLTNVLKNDGIALVFLGIKEKGKKTKLLIYDWQTLGSRFAKNESIAAKELREHEFIEADEDDQFDLTEWKEWL